MSLSITGTRVLIVEDRPDVQAIAKAILTRLGCQVCAARTAEEAILVIAEDEASIDLVFADIKLPGGMSGIELAGELRRRWPGIKTILTSGFPGPGDVRAEAREGGFPVLPKPYRAQQLAEAIRRIL